MEYRNESLGTQVVEGVPAEGTRTVGTIPVGQIGNERPIEVTSEQWYSKELQMTLTSRRLDPRTGETTYRVSNLRRGEPDPLLFQVPADYTLKTDPENVLRVIK
jgi:predicted secreted hydrolase